MNVNLAKVVKTETRKKVKNDSVKQNQYLLRFQSYSQYLSVTINSIAFKSQNPSTVLTKSYDIFLKIMFFMNRNLSWTLLPFFAFHSFQFLYFSIKRRTTNMKTASNLTHMSLIMFKRLLNNIMLHLCKSANMSISI